MAELADALDSGSNASNGMEVQVLLPAPKSIEAKARCFFVLLIQTEKAAPTV